MWTKHMILKNGMPVKVYINETNTEAVVFPLFGRYYTLRSDVNVLDFTTDFLLGGDNKVITFQSYLNGMEDTAVIQIDKIAG